MRQYLYISTAVQVPAEDLAAILGSCERNNPAAGVTGLLLYNGRNFLQLLEGEQDELERIMRRVEHDSRHQGISRLYDEGIEARACDAWWMKRIALGEPGEARHERLDGELPQALDPHVRRLILNFAMLN
ncbi:BLUF domain-containing protein [Altererythrobacter sp. H2]|uniref:BLUF domain-containing protein n=1 Tax=Altererythrobacter sp. H2 TaxID=3108391 RepID=UPI002B4BF946|nr:BLUF domain-containing protein [Altererythrobacter sp. H2]WRK96051.1 BLUF domain-containing protein [Altererythrobacter sp. H2]